MTTEKKKKKKIELNDEVVRSHFHIICSCSCLLQDTEDIEPVPDSEIDVFGEQAMHNAYAICHNVQVNIGLCSFSL